VRQARYWDVRFEAQARSPEANIEATRQRLDDAVQCRLVSDVPLGVFLSGGLDSSTVAYLMTRHSREPVRAFTLGFSEGKDFYNEWEYAREVAEAIGAEARELTIPAPTPALLEAVTRSFDEPFGNPTDLLLYQLSEAARKHVTVVLAGDAGDEVFLGYPRYQGAVLAQRYRGVPLALRRAIARGGALLPEGGQGNHTSRRVREFLAGSTLAPEQMYLEWVSYFTPPLQRRLYTAEVRHELADYDSSQFLLELFARSGAGELLDRINYVDLHSFLPYNLLRYSDRMSMAHGLEIRCPFTDHRLVEFMASVPWRSKLRRNRTKIMLREAARDWLPASVFRRAKLGLNPPTGLWLRGRLKPALDEYLSPARLRERGYFRPPVVAELIRDHMHGRRDYSLHLWALISFEAWHRQYLDGVPGVVSDAKAAASAPASS